MNQGIVNKDSSSLLDRGKSVSISRFLVFLVVFGIWNAGVQAAEPSPPSLAFSQAVVALQSAAGNQAIITRSPATHYVSFLRSPTPVPVGKGTAEARARAFLMNYGSAFVANKTKLELNATRVQENDEVGMSHVRFQQLFNGVPVTMGEVSVHLNAAGVTAANAILLPTANGLNTTPTFMGDAAMAVAREMLVKHKGANAGNAKFSIPRLEIFNRQMLNRRAGVRPSHLAWFIEATGPALREYIWVDAHDGTLLLHFSQLTDARNRLTYDAQNTATIRMTLKRSEGEASIGDADVDNAHKYAGSTYNYYWNQHHRDSYDGLGATIHSTVRFCDPDAPNCPMQNAFWNGFDMAYGQGFSQADDIVAHELTHAVTEFSASLIYQYESGALNESYSDIFGETVDLRNGSGTDTPAVRWQMGEDLPGTGAGRNMMDPTLFGDPGKVSDTQYHCGGADHGGVHTNSGVPNHAYALMTDGGTYNGQSISGIGLIKAGKIQYRALTVYLTQSSTFLDNYNALNQSCTDLIGTAGITAANCTQVTNALKAVEMDTPPCNTPPIAYCPAGQTPNFVFQDDLENTTSGNWMNNVATGVNHWNLGAGTPDIYFPDHPKSGIYSFWGYDYGTFDATGDSTVEMASPVTLLGGARMQYEGNFDFEVGATVGYDGGVVEYSIDNGATWLDAGSLISAGQAYNGAISTRYGNPLAGQQAFTGASGQYLSTQMDLSTLAGQNFKARFRIGTDNSVGAPGWVVDDIAIYTCAAVSAACQKSGYVSRVTVKPGAQNSTIYLRTSSLASSYKTFTTTDTKLVKAAVKSLPGRTYVQIKGNANCTTATSGGAAQFVIVAP